MESDLDAGVGVELLEVHDRGEAHFPFFLEGSKLGIQLWRPLRENERAVQKESAGEEFVGRVALLAVVIEGRHLFDWPQLAQGLKVVGLAGNQGESGEGGDSDRQSDPSPALGFCDRSRFHPCINTQIQIEFPEFRTRSDLHVGAWFRFGGSCRWWIA